MAHYEIRYDDATDSVRVLENGCLLREFTCAYRGRIKAACIALEWLDVSKSNVTFTDIDEQPKEVNR